MLNKVEIERILKDLNLPKNEYSIVAGAALVMHGVREFTGDIDLGCTSMLFEKIIARGYKAATKPSGDRYLSINESVEVFENWLPMKIVMINELPVGSLESIKKMKQELGRDKDIRDIELIDSFLGRGRL